MNALKQLQQLDFEARKAKYPNTPDYAIPRQRLTGGTSNGLTRCILRWLELHGHWATRISTTGRKLKDTHVVDVIGRARVMPGKWIPGTTKRGTADVHASINGRHISIEVKVGRDVMSEAQHKVKAAIESAGGVYYIAHDFESFVAWYGEFTTKMPLE